MRGATDKDICFSLSKFLRFERKGDRKGCVVEMKRGESGDLIITFNNHNLSYEVTNASLAAGKWTTVACGVDFSAHKILVYINRIKSAEFDLPKDFKLRVIGSTAEERDKNWSFTNYSNSNVFHGFVDELILYNRMLTDSELSEIPLTP